MEKMGYYAFKGKENVEVVDKTANYTILESDLGKTFTNRGDTGAITFTLPESKVGMLLHFDVKAAQTMSIAPYSGESIASPLSGVQCVADEALICNVIGSRITLECNSAGTWDVVKSVGSWHDDITVVTGASPYTVLAGQTERTFNTIGAAGAVTFNLPEAVVGLKYIFHVEDAQSLILEPYSTDNSIALPSSGAQQTDDLYITANAAGEMVEIECLVAKSWNVNNYIGTWTVESA